MPVVIPAGASSSSSVQSVPGQYVYDYILDDSGAPIGGAKVTAILNGSFVTSISPQVTVQPTQREATTDGNGFWQLSLIPNSNLSPANTTYRIQTPFRSYDITVGANGPYQSTSTGTLVGTPTTLAPATTGIIGPLSITGLLTVSAGATISGGLTVASGTFSIPGGAFSMAGPLTLTAATSQIVPGATSMAIRNNANGADNLLVSNAGLVTARAGLVATAGGVTATAGDVAVTAGNVTMGAAASRLVPGATSFAVRDAANANDNLLISNAGVITVRAGLTVTAGGLTVTAGGQIITAGNLTLTAGNLIFAAASAKILPGATSLLVRNNADSASNLAITDAGLLTARNALSVPPSAGAALPTTTYGTLQVKLDEQSTASGASVTLTVPAGGPFRELMMVLAGRSDQAGAQNLQMQLNADTGANYDYQLMQDLNATLSGVAPGVAATSGVLGILVPSGAVAGAETNLTVFFSNADSATLRKQWRSWGGGWEADAAASARLTMAHGQWRNTAAAITSIKLQPPAGNLISFRAVLYGIA